MDQTRDCVSIGRLVYGWGACEHTDRNRTDTLDRIDRIYKIDIP